MKAVVFGNVTLDVICSTVNDVPRYESLAFDQVVVSPGGCGSNVAIGLCALGQPTALVGRVGSDDAAKLVESYWQRVGLETTYIQRVEGLPTGTSIGLIDQDAQPRFIHTSGANKTLTADAIDLERLAREGAKSLHIAGFFVLPGVMDGGLVPVLAAAQGQGILTSLDVVRSPRMADPRPLWPCLPYLNIMLCNAAEAMRISGIDDPIEAARALRQRGVSSVIVKLGKDGCWLEDEANAVLIPATQVKVTVDTTGAGDAFAAGLIAALLEGKNLPDACREGNRSGASAVEHLGAVSAWFV